MLKLIITLAVIGAIAGLIFSRSGRESEGFFSGAKKGAKIGCLLCLVFVILMVLLIIGMAASEVTL